MSFLKKSYPFWMTFFSLCIVTTVAKASYTGRIISGGYLSKEVFRNELLPANRYNDVLILSERFFLNFEDIWNKKDYEVTLDLRDKNNFFDKVDRQAKQLTSSNKIILNQLYLYKKPVSNNLQWQLGRFSIFEAGATTIDGIDLGISTVIKGINFHYSLFAGFNPKDGSNPELKFDSNKRTFGGYTLFEDKGSPFEKYLFVATSVVQEYYKKQLDRFFLYNNTTIQKTDGINFNSLLYMDFYPKIQIQNWWMSYLFFLGRWSSRVSLLTVDALEYVRVADIRETLDPSRYYESSFGIRSPFNKDKANYDLKMLYGKRVVDKKDKYEARYGINFSEKSFFNLSPTIFMGGRKNFDSNDVFIGYTLNHDNDFREINFDQQFIKEKKDTGINNFAILTDFTYTKFFSRSLFGTFTAQSAYDSEVTILSLLFKISYRFGAGSTAPLRDGSSARGHL